MFRSSRQERNQFWDLISLSDKLSIPALAIDGEKANGEVLGQQIKVVASDATVVIVKNTRR